MLHNIEIALEKIISHFYLEHTEQTIFIRDMPLAMVLNIWVLFLLLQK